MERYKRLGAPMTVYQGLNKTPVKFTTLGILLNHIQNGDKQRADKLKFYYENQKEMYDNLKLFLFGFSAGTFDSRADASCVEYTGLMFFDFDKIGNESMQSIFDAMCTLPYVYTCFASPSGHGLRVGVWTNAREENHKTTYKHILSLINVAFDSAIEKHADSKCCNVSRFFFFVPTNLFYVNYDSETIPEVITLEYVPNCFVQQLFHYEDKDLILKGCVEMMNRKRIFFTFGNRANYIFSLARTMTEHGLSRYEILNHCNSLAEPNSPGRQQFTTKEIERQVDFGIKRATNQFTVNQLKKYLQW